MAGHSKWANIKHRKGKADAKKGKIFSRIAKGDYQCSKIRRSRSKNNPVCGSLCKRLVMRICRMIIIERNIKKASSADQADYHEMTYELYGHGGVVNHCGCDDG